MEGVFLGHFCQFRMRAKVRDYEAHAQTALNMITLKSALEQPTLMWINVAKARQQSPTPL